jgi:hypothetical protein
MIPHAQRGSEQPELATKGERPAEHFQFAVAKVHRNY